MLKKLKKILIVFFSVIIIAFVALIFVRNYFSQTFTRFDGFSGNYIIMFAGTFYSYESYYDAGPSSKQFGYLDIDNYKYQLKEFPYITKKDTMIPKEYYKIIWGNDEYLVEKDRVIDFCNVVNSGILYKSSKGFLGKIFMANDNNLEIGLSETPEVPNNYKRMLLKRPIEGQIIKIVSENYSFTINKGKRDSLFIGCELFKMNSYITYNIIKMNDSTSILQNQFLHKFYTSKEIKRSSTLRNNLEEFAKLKVGDTVSTFDIRI